MHFTYMQYLLFIVLHFMCINGRDLVVSGHPKGVRGTDFAQKVNLFRIELLMHLFLDF